ncbi:MAG: histidine triad nucleotide-binding protein [Nitrospinae bacterium]|nr:histidine triad nucleotide-binding protein [Nitrospinota bacterium]
MSDCLFCKIIKKEIPAEVVYSNNVVTAFKDINPQAPTHILIIPNKHVADIHELSSENDCGEIMAAITKGIKEITDCEGIDESGFRVVTNKGTEAGQTVFHLHFHILGGREFRWPPG